MHTCTHTHAHMYMYTHRVSDTGIRYLLEGNQLKELNLTNCIKISDVTLLRMTQWCVL